MQRSNGINGVFFSSRWMGHNWFFPGLPQAVPGTGGAQMARGRRQAQAVTVGNQSGREPS